jgi:hypothetical protein
MLQLPLVSGSLVTSRPVQELFPVTDEKLPTFDARLPAFMDEDSLENTANPLLARNLPLGKAGPGSPESGSDGREIGKFPRFLDDGAREIDFH